MASVEASRMLAAAAAACDDKKAEDIRILALDPAESGLSDYFLLCTGTNDRQTVAITDEIELRLKREFGAYPNAVEGRRQGEWILMDYVDFIVHVFLPEKRAFYGLERLRPSATTLSVADLNAEIKQAIRAERAAKKTTGPNGTTESDRGEHMQADAKPTRGTRAARGKAVDAEPSAKPAKSAKSADEAPDKPARKATAKRPVAAKALGARASARAAAGASSATPARKSSAKQATAGKPAAKAAAKTAAKKGVRRSS